MSINSTNRINIEKISKNNASYQKFEVLLTNKNKRYKYNEFMVEGVRNINEAINNNWKINSFIYSYEKKLSKWAFDILHNIKTDINYELSERLMTELSGKENTSELIAIIKMKSNIDMEIEVERKIERDKKFSENPVIALFDRPSNKGNLGTILRSCDAFGVEKLIITGHSVDIYEPDVIGASMGSFFKIPFMRFSDNADIDNYITGLKQTYPLLKVIGTTAHDKTNIYEIDMTTPVLFLIGNEADGLNKHYLEISDFLATIPMSEQSSASSFNVSCAATVIFYEAFRQRGKIL